MKRFFAFVFAIIVFVAISGCGNKKDLYLPKAKNDKIYTTISGNETYNGDGYTISVPAEDYRYEIDYESGNLEEKWEHKKKDDVEIKVTTYKNTDEISARSKFLNEYEDHIFEDFMGYPVCGMESDGDTLWFNLYEADETVFIVSWEYPKNTDESLKTELSDNPVSKL